VLGLRHDVLGQLSILSRLQTSMILIALVLPRNPQTPRLPWASICHSGAAFPHPAVLAGVDRFDALTFVRCLPDAAKLQSGNDWAASAFPYAGFGPAPSAVFWVPTRGVLSSFQGSLLVGPSYNHLICRWPDDPTSFPNPIDRVW